MNPPVNASVDGRRLISIDALRGFDMLWICGADALVRELAKTTKMPIWQDMAWQMQHAGWTGFRFYDLIFPLFLFLSGVTIPYSLGRRMDGGASRAVMLRHIVIRWLVLVLLGIAYNGGLQWKPLAETRVFSVLGLIGTGWSIAAVLWLCATMRARVVTAVTIIMAYMAVLKWIPVPGIGAGVLTPDGCITGWVDRMMPWRLYQHSYDPEGLLPCLASTFVALAGCLTGEFLRAAKWRGWMKAPMLAGVGALILLLGWQATWLMAPSKPMWNPPFMLICVGWSLLLLSLFYLLCDGIGLKRLAWPLVVIGMNSITIYLLLRIIPFDEVAGFFFAGVIRHSAAHWQPVMTAASCILTWWLLLWFFYRRRWFFRV